MVNTLIRITALLFTHEHFGRLKIVSRMTWSLLFLCVVYGLAVLLEVFLICRPMAVDWNASIDGKCGDQILSYLVLEILGLFLDLTTVAVPILATWRLQVSLARKLSIAILLSIGIL